MRNKYLLASAAFMSIVTPLCHASAMWPFDGPSKNAEPSQTLTGSISGSATIDAADAAAAKVFHSTMSAEAAKAAKERDELRKKAEMLVPFVKAAQAARLAKFEKAHDDDVKSFHFRAERWGDFLAVFVERGGVKTVESINLGPSSTPTIVLKHGHAPDLAGSGYFKACYLVNNGINSRMSSIHFDDVDIPDVPKCDTSYDFVNLGLPKVDGIARSAEDDAVVFGEGGGYASYTCGPYLGNTAESGGAVGTSCSPSQQMPGATLSVPAGKGDEVYRDVLAAIKEGIGRAAGR